MKVLFIINDAPAYNALRMAMALQKEHSETEIYTFLMADAVTCILPNQATPNGYYNIERMLKAIIAKGGHAKACGSCSEARGIKEVTLIEGTEISSMSQLARWIAEADKALTL